MTSARAMLLGWFFVFFLGCHPFSLNLGPSLCVQNSFVSDMESPFDLETDLVMSQMSFPSSPIGLGAKSKSDSDDSLKDFKPRLKTR